MKKFLLIVLAGMGHTACFGMLKDGQETAKISQQSGHKQPAQGNLVETALKKLKIEAETTKTSVPASSEANVQEVFNKLLSLPNEVDRRKALIAAYKTLSETQCTPVLLFLAFQQRLQEKTEIASAEAKCADLNQQLSQDVFKNTAEKQAKLQAEIKKLQQQLNEDLEKYIYKEQK